MVIEKQIAANRVNSLKGGVKTEAGKAAVQLNAVSHGLFAKDVLLPGEDGRQLAALRGQFIAEAAPEGEMEYLLVERIVTSAWRLKRALRIEKRSTKGGGDYRHDAWQYCMRYETALERQIYKALHELRILQQARLSLPASPSEPADFVEEKTFLPPSPAAKELSPSLETFLLK